MFSGDAQEGHDCLHREPFFLGKGIRKRSFFFAGDADRVPQDLRLHGLLTQDAFQLPDLGLELLYLRGGTTWSSALTATSAPSRMCLRQWNI